MSSGGRGLCHRPGGLVRDAGDLVYARGKRRSIDAHRNMAMLWVSENPGRKRARTGEEMAVTGGQAARGHWQHNVRAATAVLPQESKSWVVSIMPTRLPGAPVGRISEGLLPRLPAPCDVPAIEDRRRTRWDRTVASDGRAGATGLGGGRMAPAVSRPSNLVTRRMADLAYRTGVRLKLSPYLDASTISWRSRGLSVGRSSVSDDKQDNGLSLGSAECGETFDERHGWGHGSSTGS